MKISNVEAFLLSCPMPEPIRLAYYGGERTILKRDALLVRVTADNGLCGWAPGVADEGTVAAVRQVAEYLIGHGLDGHQLRGWAEFGMSGDRQVGNAYRAAEIAILDLVGRYEGAPLTELIGGRVRDTIPLYASGGMYQPPEGYAAEAAAVAELGFRAYKLRVGGGPDDDVATVDAVRAATGSDFGVMVDAHTWWRMGDRSYDAETVAELAQRFAAYRLTWLEEPLPPADYPAYQRLRALGAVPIATGEHEPDEAGLTGLISSGTTDYVQADLCSHGGLRLGQRVLPMVRDAGLRFAFHSWGTTLEVLAAAHLGVCWPESVVPWLEYPMYANAGRPGMYAFPLADELLADPLDIRDGELHMPPGPGLGIDIDPRVIDRYPYLPGPWSTFRLHSPPQTFAVTGDHSITAIPAP